MRYIQLNEILLLDIWLITPDSPRFGYGKSGGYIEPSKHDHFHSKHYLLRSPSLTNPFFFCSLLTKKSLYHLFCLLSVFQNTVAMPPTYFPLRWESTGDQWWYATPIDYAAANCQYDLVRELLRIDSNNLMKLTSLRRIRRLETVWDDDESHFHDVAACRSRVARKLLASCDEEGSKANTLIRSGYAGWLMYTAASAGDLGFVRHLLERNPLFVFGEGEYGVTDILYAAARSKNHDVFRLIYDFAVSPRFETGCVDQRNGDIPAAYKREMKNRAVHSASRGGNLVILTELLSDCSVEDVLAFRDKQGSTILHAAAGKGKTLVTNSLFFFLLNYIPSSKIFRVYFCSTEINYGNKCSIFSRYFCIVFEEH